MSQVMTPRGCFGGEVGEDGCVCVCRFAARERI